MTPEEITEFEKQYVEEHPTQAIITNNKNTMAIFSRIMKVLRSKDLISNSDVNFIIGMIDEAKWNGGKEA